MKQTLHALTRWFLTPTTLFINLAEWLKQLTINQYFTYSISAFVLIYWALMAREKYFSSQIQKRKLKEMDE